MSKKIYEGYDRYDGEGNQYTEENNENTINKKTVANEQDWGDYERYDSDGNQYTERNQSTEEKVSEPTTKEQPTQVIDNTMHQEQLEVSSESKEMPKSLKEIGAERRAAVLEKGKNTWLRIKGGFSKGFGMLKEKAANVVDYAFAAPEAINKGAQAVGQAGLEAGQYATGKVAEAGEFVTEKAKNAKAKVEDGTKFVLNKAQEGYDALSSRGQQAYEKLKGRIDAAKDRWNDYRNQKRIEKLKLEAQRLEGAESSQREIAAAAAEKAVSYQKQKEEIRKKMEELRIGGGSLESVAEASI